MFKNFSFVNESVDTDKLLKQNKTVVDKAIKEIKQYKTTMSLMLGVSIATKDFVWPAETGGISNITFKSGDIIAYYSESLGYATKFNYLIYRDGKLLSNNINVFIGHSSASLARLILERA